MEVALSTSTLPEFQGSAWEQGDDIPTQSVVRHALMTPRVLAPHGNRRPSSISPAQAIALLVQMRLTTLKRWQEVEPLLDHARAGESTEWGWRFYAALWRAFLEADLEPLGTIHEEAPDGAEPAAAVAALASIRFGDESMPPTGRTP